MAGSKNIRIFAPEKVEKKCIDNIRPPIAVFEQREKTFHFTDRWPRGLGAKPLLPELLKETLNASPPQSSYANGESMRNGLGLG